MLLGTNIHIEYYMYGTAYLWKCPGKSSWRWILMTKVHQINNQYQQLGSLVPAMVEDMFNNLAVMVILLEYMYI